MIRKAIMKEYGLSELRQVVKDKDKTLIKLLVSCLKKLKKEVVK